MKSVLLIMLFAVSALFARDNENYTGWGDTTRVLTFRDDSLRYTDAKRLSAHENLRVTVLVNDTGTALFANDSVMFSWGIQTGRQIIDSAGEVDTAWNPQMLLADTCDVIIDGSYGPSYITIGTDGSYSDVPTLLDTVSVTGFIVQSRNIAPAWDVLVRAWAKGETGCRKGKDLLLFISMTARQWLNAK